MNRFVYKWQMMNDGSWKKKCKGDKEFDVLSKLNCEVSEMMQAVFDIDLIGEKIFSNLDRRSLLNARLVCHRWTVLSAKELQKVVEIEIIMRQKIAHLKNSPELTIESLIDLMERSSKFPCTSFALSTPEMFGFNPAVSRFFEIHGTCIKTMKVESLLILPHFPSYSNFSTEGEKKECCFLLKVPNLQVLKVFGDIEMEDFSDSAFFSSHYPVIVLSKLKVLLVFDEIPSIFFLWILQCSPNLNSVELSSKNLPYLLQPELVNRLHLLKNLTIDFDDDSLNQVDAFAEGIEVLRSKNSFTSQFSPNEVTVKVYRVVRHPHLWSRVSRIASQILNACSTSVEKLIWDQMRFLDGLKMPEEMSRVKEIVLHNRNFHPLVPKQYFPKGMSLQKVFPNLNRVCLVHGGRDYGSSYYGSESFSFNDYEPVNSLKYFCVENIKEDKIDLPYFKTLFPHAVFKMRNDAK